jgi:hypothetical protein
MQLAAVELPAMEVLIGLLVTMGIYWVVYSIVLFLLMKVQGWHVGPIALLGSTALATTLAQIPFVGPYVGTAVLALCIWKASGSDLTDSIFSVVIAGAIMFAFQIFALTALVGKLEIGGLEEELEGEPGQIVEVEATDSWTLGGGDPVLYLKGITLSTNGHMVLVGSGTANHSFTNGELKIVNSPKGRLTVLCELIRTNEVIMKVDWKDRQFRVPLVPSATLQVVP